MPAAMSAADDIRAGIAAEEAGDFVGAAAVFESLVNDPVELVRAQARFHLGRVTWRQGQTDRALVLCEEARVLAIRLHDAALRAQVENAIGVLHVSRGEYEQARAAYGVALALSTDQVIRAKTALNLGVIANIQGHYDRARRHYQESRTLFRSASDDRGEALALHNLGMLHADLGEWDEAEEAFDRALHLFESHGNRQMIGNVLINRSEVCYGRGQVQDAIGKCDLALSIYAEIGDELGRGEALRWKVHGLRSMGLYAEAEENVQEAIRIAERTHTPLLHAEATRELARIRLAQGDATQGRTLLERALQTFRELGAQREVDGVMAEVAALDRRNDR